MKRSIAILVSIILPVVVSACLPRPQRGEQTASLELATPVAESPAAGFCAEHEGDLAIVMINPAIPDPRCSYVRADQHLRVVNMRSEQIEVKLARLKAQIAPGGDHIFAEPFGDLLMPGVHRFEVSPCCGAELILRTD